MKTIMTLDDWIDYTAQSNDRTTEVIYGSHQNNYTRVTILKSTFDKPYYILYRYDGVTDEDRILIVYGDYYFIVSDTLYAGQCVFSLINTDLSVYDNHISELEKTPFYHQFLEAQ